jgi:hypothetical protein
MIALDLSRSMWTEDVGPSRLDLAKQTVEKLLNGLKGESVGLIVFAGTAFVQVPLSPDYQIIREFMPSLDPDYMPQGGSDYQKLLEAALEGFGEKRDRDRYLVILSDGESSTRGWQNRLADLAKRDIHVVGIGVGTAKGGFINDQKGGYLADRNGDAILTRLQPATLQTLANRTNGKYVEASTLATPEAVRALIKDTVETGRQGRVNNEATNMQIERFQWLLIPAVLLGLADHMAKFGYDAFDLQLMVEATIKYGVDEKRQGNPPLEGAIHDALEAARLGEQLDPKRAPWSYYRSQLAATLVADADDATNGERSKNPHEANDEEDNGPMVIGQNTQHGGSDSYGEGAASKGDAALGDLSADDNFIPPHRDHKPKPPSSVRNATFTHSGGENSDNQDPILAFAKKNLAQVIKQDSPGRLHQMLAEDTGEQKDNEMDW